MILIILEIQQQSLSSMFWMFSLILIIFYFFMIRPQLKRQKLEKKFQENIKKGDRVVTSGGIHGKIIEITDNLYIIETSAGKIKFERNSISREMTQLRYIEDIKSLEIEKSKIKNNKS